MTENRTNENGAADVAELARVYADIARKSGQMLTEYLRHPQQNGVALPFDDQLGIAKAFFEAWSRMLTDPLRLAEAQVKLWQDYMALWQNSMLKALGQQTKPVVETPEGDRRFRHEDWQQSFLHDYIKQSYLITARHLHQMLANVQGLDEKTAKKVDFYTRQYIDALSPSNFLMTNPEVLRETVASGGQNLVKGLNNLLEDLARGNGAQLRVKMTDTEAFRLGENIAVTPGKVVFQNELLQLIQYAPRSDKVYARPLLIIPPWINKYYILDLREKNSFIRWAVEQGHTVFVVSWVNPDEGLAHKTFDDYLVEGALAALQAVERATGQPDANVIGYCLGGTLLACALAWLEEKKESRVHSATFFVSMIDFAEPGELEVFIDEDQLAALESRMAKRGYLEGSEMATTFNMLRANDLIWSFVVNNYLLGKDPFPFDLLYWNSDSTRMPAAMHGFYLRNMYLKNLLRVPGGLKLAGVPIDVTRVRVPAYFISTMEDHIAPWKSTYAGAKLLNGPVRFVLGGSGHIAGIINPPGANKYCYWTSKAMADSADEWLEKATQHTGSWWSDWGDWIAAHGGEKIAARIPGKGPLKAIEDAPGSYARMRADTH